MSYNVKNIINGYKSHLKFEWGQACDLGIWTLDEFADMSADWINERLEQKYVFDYRVTPEDIKGWLNDEENNTR